MEAKNSISLARLCSTLAAVLDVPAPEKAEPPLDWAVQLLKEQAGGPIQRALIYNPDAVAQWLFHKNRLMFQPVLEQTQLVLPLRAVMPSVTPVCFGTMYTGAQPEVHGIQAYEKPVIAIDSLFDALVRAGKKVALVAVEGSSMAIIYNNRPIDYFYLPYDKEVEEKALELIDKDQCDVIVAYTQEYDDVMHRTGVDSLLSMQALSNQIGIFQRLCRKAAESWKDKTSLVAFCPDHGVHQQEDVHGNHGLDIPEDLNIQHFLGVRRAVK